MSRLFTMARFEEPSETEPVCTCSSCDGELWEGETVYVYDGEVFCSHDCLVDYIGPTTKTL